VDLEWKKSMKNKYRVTVRSTFEVDGDTIWPEKYFTRSAELAKKEFVRDAEFLASFIKPTDINVEDISAIGAYDFED
jgi:hypothetical protein